MKKTINIILGALLLISCTEDIRYTLMVDNSLYFVKSELQIVSLYDVDYNDYRHDVTIYKGGFYDEQADGMVEIDYSYLVEYNDFNDADYDMLEQKYFNFERNFTIASKSTDYSLPLFIDNSLIAKDKGYGTYYIPLSVNSRSKDVVSNSKNSKLLLQVEIKQPKLIVDSEWGGVSSQKIGMTDFTSYDITAGLGFDAYEDYTIYYEWVPMMVPEGKKIIDKRFVQYDSQSVILKGKRSAMENKLVVISRLNTGTEGDELAPGEWVIPIKLTIESSKFDTSEAYVLMTVNK